MFLVHFIEFFFCAGLKAAAEFLFLVDGTDFSLKCDENGECVVLSQVRCLVDSLTRKTSQLLRSSCIYQVHIPYQAA